MSEVGKLGPNQKSCLYAKLPMKLIRIQNMEGLSGLEPNWEIVCCPGGVHSNFTEVVYIEFVELSSAWVFVSFSSLRRHRFMQSRQV